MKNLLEILPNAENQIKAGLIFSAGLITISLLRILGDFDWLLVFLSGLTTFVFTMGVFFNCKITEHTEFNEKTETTKKRFELNIYRWNILSQFCFGVGFILLILTIIRIIILVLR